MFIIVGSMIGTMMAGNVLFVIIPGHWELIRAKRAGREPDPAPGMKGKLRSVHNNYLTLPVVLAMLSNHFPFVYGHDDAWLVLCAFVVLGVYVRHFFNLRHAGRTRWSMPVVAAAAVVAMAFWLAPPDEPSAPASSATSSAGKRVFLTAGCVSCHTLSDAGADGAHRARPRRRQALARARDQPRDQRPGCMPSFANKLSKQQIEQVADYVSSVAGERSSEPRACARCSRAISSSSARTRCPLRTTGSPPT